jgi:hypothetical protein
MFTLQAKISSKNPVVLCVKGIDKDNPETYYFCRILGSKDPSIGLFQGDVTFEFPFPIAPKSGVVITAYDALTGSNKGILIKSVVKKELSFDKAVKQYSDDLWEYIDFAYWFALNAKQLKPAMYFSKNKKYKINYSAILEGENMEKKPAEVAHSWFTGLSDVTDNLVEVSKNNIQGLSVSHIIMILFHELAHMHLSTKDEFLCDKFAFNMATSLGFSDNELWVVILHLFSNTEKDSDQEKRAVALAQLIAERKRKLKTKNEIKI